MSWTLISSQHKKYLYIHGCGNLKTYRSIKEFNKNTQKCIRCQKAEIKPVQQVFDIYNKNASVRKIEFDLDIRDFEYLIRLNCFYCGEEPSIRVNGRWCNEVWYDSFKRNGLDRMNPNDSYSLDNIVPCCFKCNKLKGNMGFDEFIDLIQKINQKLVHPKTLCLI